VAVAWFSALHCVADGWVGSPRIYWIFDSVSLQILCLVFS
jgi:hypothetical protein